MIPRETKCKYCGKSILWVMTAEGKRIPFLPPQDVTLEKIASSKR